MSGPFFILAVGPAPPPKARQQLGLSLAQQMTGCSSYVPPSLAPLSCCTCCCIAGRRCPCDWRMAPHVFVAWSQSLCASDDPEVIFPQQAMGETSTRVLHELLCPVSYVHFHLFPWWNVRSGGTSGACTCSVRVTT